MEDETVFEVQAQDVDALSALMHSRRKDLYDIPTHAPGPQGRLPLTPQMLREWAAFQRQHPLILAPIGTQPAPRAASDLEPGGAEAGLLQLRMTVAVNFLGLPAAAVAIPGDPTQAVPQAVQVIGPRYREDLCLAAAEAIEGAVGAPEPIDPVTAGRSRG